MNSPPTGPLLLQYPRHLHKRELSAEEKMEYEYVTIDTFVGKLMEWVSNPSKMFKLGELAYNVAVTVSEKLPVSISVAGFESSLREVRAKPYSKW